MKDIISKRRRELGLTQQQLADKLHISDKVVSKWETGRSLPDTSLLRPLADALQMPLNDLLDAGGAEEIDKAADCAAAAAYKNCCILTMAGQLAAAVLLCAGRVVLDRIGYYGEDLSKPLAYILIVLGALCEIAAVTFCIVRRNALLAKYPSRTAFDKKYVNILLFCTYPLVLAVLLVFIVLHGLSTSEQLTVLLLSAAAALLPFIAGFIANKKRKD